MLAQVHLDEIKACLSSSPILQTVSVSVEHSGHDHGYFRAKATLINGDFLEVAEYCSRRFGAGSALSSSMDGTITGDPKKTLGQLETFPRFTKFSSSHSFRQ